MKMNQQPFDPNQYPGFWEQMNNFKDFLKEVGQGVAEDGTLWSDKTMEERDNIPVKGVLNLIIKD